MSMDEKRLAEREALSAVRETVAERDAARARVVELETRIHTVRELLDNPGPHPSESRRQLRTQLQAAVAEVRRLQAVVAELKAEFGSITRNASRAERARCAKVADDYAKRAWGAQNPCQPAAVAAEHVARDIRALPDE